MTATRPRLLDLFCGAGGAAVGYHRAGWDVVGVDIDPQPNYPYEFHQADAMAYPLAGFDAVHASPPCQGYSWSTRRGREERWPLLVGAVRTRLEHLPYVIENVPNARRDMLPDHAVLCGTMFGLGLIKHRLFESSAQLWPVPGHPRCSGLVAQGVAVTVAGHGGDSKDFRIARWQEAMGMDWTRSRHELAEAIPPAYTEWVGTRLLASLA